MVTELPRIFRDALGLFENDRATLAGLLIESLEDGREVDPDVDEAWKREAERRWREIESGKVKTIAWDDVKAKLLNGEG
jgi:putative addiction module component (TIGR02574 family)